MADIDLRLIAGSPNPVRKSWDEDKMNELAASIAEQGVIVPVKVRPVAAVEGCYRHGYDALTLEGDLDDIDERANCAGCEDLRWILHNADENEDPVFELVYGHRRVEAARRANLETIPAIVEGVDDTDALIQALIENVQREDMSEHDEGSAYLALRGLGKSYRETARMVGKAHTWIARCAALATDEAMEDVHPGVQSPANTAAHLRQVFGDDIAARRAVAEKASRDGLGHTQTRAVAESVAAAPTPEAREWLIQQPYSPTLHDPEFVKDRAREFGAHDPMYRKHATMPTYTASESPEARAVLDLVKRWRDQMRAAQQAIEDGKLAPEACRFLAGRVSKFASELASWADELGEVSE